MHASEKRRRRYRDKNKTKTGSIVMKTENIYVEVEPQLRLA